MYVIYTSVYIYRYVCICIYIIYTKTKLVFVRILERNICVCMYFGFFFLEKWNLFIKERSSINYLKLVRSTLTLWNETCFLSNNK